MRNISLKSSHVVLFVLSILFSIECNAKQNKIVVKSSNGEMHTILKWENQDILKYCILTGNDTLVSFSEMGVIGPRWARWLEAQKAGTEFDVQEWEERWINNSWKSSSKPYENPLVVAGELIQHINE